MAILSDFNFDDILDMLHFHSVKKKTVLLETVICKSIVHTIDIDLYPYIVEKASTSKIHKAYLFHLETKLYDVLVWKLTAGTR